MASHEHDETKTIAIDSATDFAIKGAASVTRPLERTEPDTCSICLESISERAVAAPCNHLTFDFLCLVQWLQQHASCPLCKAEVKEVQYDWRGPEDFKTYRVPPKESSSEETNTSRRQTQFRNRRRRRDIGFRPRGSQAPSAQEDTGLTRRRQVYEHRTYSYHVGSNRVSQYRDFTPADFTSSSDLQSRARAFLRRELRVFGFLDRQRTGGGRGQRGSSRDFLLEYIIAVLKTHEPKAAEGHAEDFVAEFLGRDNAKLLLHELDAWLRSPYATLDVWDGHVQYASRPPNESSRKDNQAGNSRQ